MKWKLMITAVASACLLFGAAAPSADAGGRNKSWRQHQRHLKRSYKNLRRDFRRYDRQYDRFNRQYHRSMPRSFRHRSPYRYSYPSGRGLHFGTRRGGFYFRF
ncbi:MAG: hypothetical protein RIK87_05290 [Fuerstiella sp.]